MKVGHWSFISEEFEMKALVGDLLGPRPFDCSNLRNSMKLWMMIFGTLVVMGLYFNMGLVPMFVRKLV